MFPAGQLGGIDVNPPILAQDVKPCADKLRQSLSELRREQRQTEAAQFAKNEAMDEFNHGFLSSADWWPGVQPADRCMLQCMAWSERRYT